MSARGFHLFVYGTLRGGAGGEPAPGLARCVKVADGHVRGTLYDLGDFPAILLSGNDEVRGEVWRCPSEMLDELDAYEGVADGLFRRAGVRVGSHACWIYVAGPKLGPRLTADRRIRQGEDRT